jgi:hypothetical protein
VRKSDADSNARFDLGDALTLGMWKDMSAVIPLTQFCVGPAVQRALGRELNMKVVRPEHEVQYTLSLILQALMINDIQ